MPRPREHEGHLDGQSELWKFMENSISAKELLICIKSTQESING